MKLLTSNLNNWQPEFVKEYPKMLAGKHPLHLYRAKENKPGIDNDETWYRWFFGFPEEVVPEGLQVLLNTTCYWGEVPTFKDGNFYLWWLAICSKTLDPPFEELNRAMNSKLRLYNKAIGTYRKWGRNMAKKDKAKKEGK